MSNISVEKTIAGVTVTSRGPRGLPGPAIQLRDNDGVLEWRVAKANPDPWVPLIDLGQFLSDSRAAADLAQKWAAEDEDVVVDEGLYSALHYAAKAAASAETADSAASAAGNAKSEAEGARDLAKDWAEKADGQDVDGAGTRSAKHWAGQAASSASTASGHADTASSQAGIATSAAQDAADARDKAEAWAETEEDTEVEEGKYSAKHWAAKAEASAEAAAVFDPSSYYDKETSDARYVAALESATDGAVAGFDGTTGKLIKALSAEEIRTAAELGTAAEKDEEDFQAANAHLSAIAGLTFTEKDIIQFRSGALVNRSIAQLIEDLEDGGLGGDPSIEISDVTGLQDALNGKAPSTHSHTISDITNLQTTLDGKQSVSAKGQPNGYAPLDSSGKVPSANLPSNSGLVLLQTVSLSSGAAAIDFTGLTNTYAAYLFVLDRVWPGSSGGYGSLCLRTSTNGGSSFDSGEGDYGMCGFYTDSVYGSIDPIANNAASEIVLGYLDNPESQREGISGEVIFHRSSGRIEFNVSTAEDTYITQWCGWGTIASGTPNAIRFFWDPAFNHASGSAIRCYGITK